MKTMRAYVDGCHVADFELIPEEAESQYGHGRALLRFARERGISPVGVSLRDYGGDYRPFYYKTNMATGKTVRVYDEAGQD